MAEYLLLAIATPFAVWAAWSDLTTMTIPNEVSELAALAFILIMPFFLPMDDYGLRIATAGWVLVGGYLLNAIGQVGGGDVKLATVLVPFTLPADYYYLLILFFSCLLVSFALHRTAMFIVRKKGVELQWQSFHAGGHFPMGVPISMAILLYLVGKALGVGPL